MPGRLPEGNPAGGFESLGTEPFFRTRLLERGAEVPTEIQRRVIPRLLAGENLFFSSAPGTGKTFAYLVPLFQRFLAGPGISGPDSPEDPAKNPGGIAADRGSGVKSGGNAPRILLCAPTYELCSQIKAEADFLLRGRIPETAAALLIGSANTGRQIGTLKRERPGVIVGNPGRLLLLARMGKLRLGAIAALVLDEGDRLVSEELREETEALIRFLPPERQSAACSATLSAASMRRLLPFLGGKAGEERAGSVLEKKIEHWAFFSEGREKVDRLRSFLAAAKPGKVLVFTSRAGQVGNIVSRLQRRHLPAGGIQGDMDKRARKAALDGFRRGDLRILVASDLACRGLDFEGLTHVVALDVPEAEAYLHRAGRTGRAGRRGIMVTIGDEEELRRLAGIEKKLALTVYPKELYGGRILAASE
ncbi:MAG: DEAD/DEAH box helicase [Treponema sp.]|nr:DEAD/DEAH box helicase [Treponema sp.]